MTPEKACEHGIRHGEDPSLGAEDVECWLFHRCVDLISFFSPRLSFLLYKMGRSNNLVAQSILVLINGVTSTSPIHRPWALSPSASPSPPRSINGWNLGVWSLRLHRWGSVRLEGSQTPGLSIFSLMEPWVLPQIPSDPHSPGVKCSPPLCRSASGHSKVWTAPGFSPTGSDTLGGAL